MVTESTQFRVIRAIIGWDRKTLAKRLDVNPNTITNWEFGRAVPNSSNRKMLAEICEEHKISIRPDGFPVVGLG